MQLYLVRHAEAEDAAVTAGGTDAERALTDDGRRKTEQVAEGLRRLGCAPDRIGASPLVRARETAEILARKLGLKASVQTCDFMAPGGNPKALLDWLRARREEQVMLVGHMPDLAGAVSFLLARNAALDIPFKKLGVCCIAFDGSPARGAGRLVSLLQPRHLRAIARAKSRDESDD